MDKLCRFSQFISEQQNPQQQAKDVQIKADVDKQLLDIDKRISEYNKNMIEYSRIFRLLTTIKQTPIMPQKAYTIIDIIDRNLRDEVFNSGYGLYQPEYTFTNSEILRKLVLKDYSKLYSTAISV